MAKPARRVHVNLIIADVYEYRTIDEAALRDLKAIQGIDLISDRWLSINPLYDAAEVLTEIESLNVTEPVPAAFADAFKEQS